MRHLFTLTLLMVFVSLQLLRAQTFVNGNLAIFVAAASANNTTGSILEFNPTDAGQSPVNTYAISGTGSNAMRFSGSATSTAYLANSDDGSLLAFTGANSTNTTSNVNTLNPRAVGTLNASYSFNLATTYTGTSGNQTRSATTLDNSNWYISDQGGLYTNGTGSASPTANIRGIKSFGGVVYVGQQSSTAANIQVSTVSAITGGTINGLPGLTNNSSFQDFYLISSGVNGSTYDVLYVISATGNTAGTIAKYSLVSGTWVANGSYATSFGGFGLAAKTSGSGAELFVSEGAGALTNNRLIKVTDTNGYNQTINVITADNVTLYTATGNTIIKGVAFAPIANALPEVNLSVSAITGSEDAQTEITVTASASSPVSGNQTVDLNVSGTGITAGDYVLSNATITILDGDTSGSVTFTIVDDSDVEGTETATLTITNPSAGIVLGAVVSQNIDITDNDLLTPSVELSVSATSGLESAGTIITVTATASQPVSGNQTVTLMVSGPGITASDYSLSGTVITIPDGGTNGSVTFTVLNDAEQEGTETALLTITNPSSGIALGTVVTQTIDIIDNNCQPLVRRSTATSTNGAEISAFDPSTNRVFTIAGSTIEYYDLSNTAQLSGPFNMPIGFTSPGNNILPNSVVMVDGTVAVSFAIVDASTQAQQPGVVAFYDAATVAYLSQVEVGYLPDMIALSPDGTKLLTANEGEPNSYGLPASFDPEGSVSIIDISAGIGSATVQTADFTAFNSQMASLKAAGVRIFGPGATVAQDLEPEYITFSADGASAYVTMQEANAIAVVDVASATVTQITPLGLKDHSQPGNGLDASDRDKAPAFSSGAINIQNWPVFGMYQPDAIAHFNAGGNDYFVTANEGDSRAWPGYNEEIRVGAAGYVLDPTVFPDAATLKLNQNLGRLQLSNATGDTDGDGDFDEIHALGARSFTIWDSALNLVYDSGDQLEQLTAALVPSLFNSDGTAGSFDTRSDNKGPEPEAVATGEVNGKLYLFVGSERTGDIFVYDLSDPAAPAFLQYINHPQDLGVEGLLFVPAEKSPTGNALLIVSAEVSRTVTVYEMSAGSSNNGPVCEGDDVVFTVTGTPGSVLTYNLNGEGNQQITLTNGSATITVSNASATQLLNLISITDGSCTYDLNGTSTAEVVPMQAWYLDADGDGYFVDAVMSCGSPGTGYTQTAIQAGDCNDNDAAVWQQATVYVDADGDLYDNGTADLCFGATLPSGYSATTLGADCDDNDASVNPGADSDGDGLNDCQEQALGTSPDNTDSDSDGLDDYDEVMIHFSDPLLQDSDGDGLTDGAEISQTQTNPVLADSNGNGCSDLAELLGACDVPGCTYTTASNYNPLATADDGSCLFDEETCPGDFDGNKVVNVSDLLLFQGWWGTDCY